MVLIAGAISDNQRFTVKLLQIMTTGVRTILMQTCQYYAKWFLFILS